MGKIMTSNFLKGAKKVETFGNYHEDIQNDEKPIFMKGARKVESIIPKKEEKSFGTELKELFTSQDETPFEEGLGTSLRAVGSAALGLPGNIRALSKKAGEGVYNFVASMTGLPEVPDTGDYNIIPTTSDVESYFDMATDGKYIPSEEEQPYYEATQDITGMLMPGSAPLKLWQRFAIPIAAQLGKEGIKAGGGGETAQELGKLGLGLGLSIASIANGEKFAGNLMSQAESLMPQGQMINATPISNSLNKIKSTPWYKGADLPSKRPAKQLIEAIEKNISNGQMDGQMALQLRKDANELQKNLGAFDIFKKEDKKKAIMLLNKAKDAVMEGLKDYGTKQDPLFWKATQEANKAYAVLSKSKVISRFIEEHAPVLKSNGIKSLFAIGGAVGELALGKVSPAAAAGVIGSIGSIAALGKTSQIMYRVMKDPNLRKYYIGALEAAAKSNSKSMIMNMQKLDEALMEDE